MTESMIELDPKQAMALAYCAKEAQRSNLQIRQVEGWGLDVLADDEARRWLIEPGGCVSERAPFAFPGFGVNSARTRAALALGDAGA